MDQQKVYVQRKWTDQELIADGFQPYRPIKFVTMVRRLPQEKAQKTVKTSRKTIVAEAQFWIAYVEDSILQEKLSDYKPRTIQPGLFARTFKSWDEPDWHPTPIQAYLRRLGCEPYYEIASVWAKQLTTDTWVQSTESTEPSLAPGGAWLCVSMEGEPRSLTDALFQAHYLLSGQN